MEYLKKKLQYFGNFFVKNIPDNKERKGSKCDVYFEQIIKIFSWADNSLTLAVFLFFNFLFWLIVYFEVRFFGMVFFTVLILFLWDSFYETKDLSSYQGKYTECLDEIGRWCKDMVLNLKILRKESPSSFCIGMSLIFLFMSFLARNMSGYVLVYLGMLVIFFVPLGYKILPEEYKDNLKNSLKSMSNVRGVLAEEELIPFISNKDFNNKEADLDSLLTDRTADSATNSLASGISGMPSYLDVAESQDGIEEEDLLPTKNTRGAVSYTPGELSSDSDSEHRDIQFDSTHFNGDSSSEEEKLMGAGLRFTSDFIDSGLGKSQLGAPESGIGTVLSNFATMGGSLMANVIKSAVTKAPNTTERKNSSSDSEFEIINSEDVRE